MKVNKREEQQTESRRDRGGIQPIRDEMELLESERRILSPGCCTGEREKGGREKERREEEGEGHATCITTLVFKGDWNPDRRKSVYRNKTRRRIKDQKRMRPDETSSEGTERFGREGRDGEKHGSEEHIKDCGSHWKVTVERKVRHLPPDAQPG